MGNARRTVSINLNARVTVRLTEEGRSLVMAYYADVLAGAPARAWPKGPPAGEEYTDSLWHLMHMLGPGLVMGRSALIAGMVFTTEEGDMVKITDEVPRG